MNDCTKCKHFNINLYNSGRWYCNSPKVSIFNLPPKMKDCFEANNKERDNND